MFLFLPYLLFLPWSGPWVQLFFFYPRTIYFIRILGGWLENHSQKLLLRELVAGFRMSGLRATLGSVGQKPGEGWDYRKGT